ncbi:MAG TPA: outer membrane beta-barrel protein, partial [Phycisphaerae bacterium]|nr:outer membrane beta-barrel protein [Phycisphaerae bacterium]
NPIHADNIYQRALVGMEGEPVAGLKFSFLVGPDFRSFTSDHLLAGMETDPRLYAEGAATWAVTRVDDLSLNIKHWTLPASGGKTLYADNCYDLGWKHAFTSQLTASLGVKALGGEWETGRRNDWVYIARAGLNYKIDRHWSLESGYECDLGRSANRNFDGRDYDRHLLWLGGRYDF